MMKYINLFIIVVTGVLFVIVLNYSSLKNIHYINFFVSLITLFVFLYVFKNEKKRDEYLSKIEEQNKNILQTQQIAKLGMWKLEIDENRLVWNEQTYKIFEIDKSSITLDEFYEAIYFSDTKRVIETYKKHLQTRENYIITFKIETKNKTIKYIEQRCKTIFDDNLKPIISLGTIQDITEKTKADMALKEKDFILIKSSRMAQMGEMINMIAHQWRQPLNSISLTVSNLQFKNQLGTIDKDLLDKELTLISMYSQHLSKTINDFRNFFKENKTKEITNLKLLIENTLDIVQKSIENKNIKIITDYSCSMSIETYPNEVMQVILNIIKNAEDVLLEKNVKNPTITIEAICQSNYDEPTIIIKDNGGGIAEDIIDKIFDLYFSTKHKKDGTGLGLYISKTIIEDHCGGKLSVKNDNDGAVFKITFKRIGVHYDRINKI